MEELKIVVTNAISASIARSVAEAFIRTHEESIKKQAYDELPCIYERVMLASLSGKFSIEYPLLVLDSLENNRDRNVYLGAVVEALGKEGYKLAYSKNTLIIRW